MKMSEAIGELAAGLAKAQGQMRVASKDRENPFFKSTYATLASVIEAIREPLSSNGLAFLQPTRIDEHGAVFVTTAIIHTSGQWICGEISAKPVKNDPQGIGSLISYLKRYGLQAMVGIASADDDANAATHREPDEEDDRYDPSITAHKERLCATLAERKIPKDAWAEISKAFAGHGGADLVGIIKRIMAARPAPGDIITTQRRDI